MKVFIYGDQVFSTDMAWGYEKLGHEASVISPMTVRDLDTLISIGQPDLIMTVGTPSFFKPEMLEHIGNRSGYPGKVIHWDTDGVTWMDIELRHIQLMKPEIVFTVCPEMLELLRGKGIRSEFLHYAYNPNVHKPGPKAPEIEGQTAFVGAAYPTVISRFPDHYRRRSLDILFKPLLDSGHRIDFYGGREHKNVIYDLYQWSLPDEWLHDYVPYNQTSRIYRSCLFNLVTQNHEHTVTKRVFEILGSGGFALSLENTAVKELFCPGRDLLVSSSPQETLALIGHYGSHPAEYEKIRENALIAAQDHTYEKRAGLILGTIKG
jgi:spore maturation protein CgeB